MHPALSFRGEPGLSTCRSLVVVAGGPVQFCTRAGEYHERYQGLRKRAANMVSAVETVLIYGLMVLAKYT